MDVVAFPTGLQVVPSGPPPEADEIYENCFTHPAVEALESFNHKLASRALTRIELRLFLASMAVFNRHTVGGIAILAGRVSDEVLPLVPTQGHEIGALILDAAVDEYGLRESVTHVELAGRFSTYLGIASEELHARAHACSNAIVLGDVLFGWYRDKPPAFSLGVHTASEVTSVKEFMSWHDVFLNFPQYRFSIDRPEFEYMRAHYVHEPDHILNARKCVGRYLDVLPGHGELLREGAQTYLDLYGRMFAELDSLIFK